MPGQVPLIGERFPEITVVTTHGPRKLPDDYKGRWLVLFSHPADFTPVCTTEFVAFARRYEDFRKLNAELLGHSVDSVYSHMKWAEWIEKNLGVRIPFPVIADPGAEVAKTLGFLHAQSATHTVRAVFVVDPNGVIRVILYYPQELGRNIDEILRILVALQVGERLRAAMPANWPNNELVGDRVIVPPPRTVEEAAERLKQYTCYDWWLCHKEGSPEHAEAARAYLRRAAGV